MWKVVRRVVRRIGVRWCGHYERGRVMLTVLSEFHSDSGDARRPAVAASAGRASTSHSNHYQIRKLEGGKALTRHLTRLPTILAKCEERCHTLGLNQAILDQIRKEKTSTEIHCDATDR
jgi:hypothetical protein